MIERSFTKIEPARAAPVDEGVERVGSIEKRIAGEFGFSDDRALSHEDFEASLTRLGFKHYKKHTYFSESLKAYAYRKEGAIVASYDDAQLLLKVVRDLTEKGLLYPETEWGVVQRPSGNFHVIAITRSLVRFTEGPQDLWSALKRPLGQELFARVGVGDAEGEIARAYEDPQSPLYHIDYGEAGHGNNWAWAPDKQRYYPIDVEVILFGEEERIKKSHDKAMELERRNQKPPEIINL
jgi:hypothetical protein